MLSGTLCCFVRLDTRLGPRHLKRIALILNQILNVESILTFKPTYNWQTVHLIPPKTGCM